MTVTRGGLERAAFWDLDICMDCGEPQTHEEREDGEGKPPCHECGGEDVWAAAAVVSLLDKIEKDDE